MAGYCRGEPATRDRAILLPYPETGAEPERLLRLMEALGAEPAGLHLEFPLSPEDETELDSSGVLKNLDGTDYFCIHPGARQRDKCWPPQRFAEVGDRLAAEFGLTPVLTGSANEADLTAEVAAHMHRKPVDAAAPISIGAMAALMRKAKLLLCNDTGVSHIAAGLKLKSVVVFSKADIARWAPLDRHSHRCIWDPDAERASVVLQHARALLAGTAPSRQRSVGMWPYW
jgi:ADP-heptose:LPS heptosyltransferase